MKKVLYVIIGLVAVYFILCLFGPSEINVNRSISVNVAKDVAKTQLLDLKFFQEKWSPWTERDPNMKVSYSGENGAIGYGYSWEGNDEVGKGTLEIKDIKEDSIIQRLAFDGMPDSRAYYVIVPEGNGSNVTWGIQFPVGFMGRAMMLFMNMDKMLGQDFESGLSKFKNAVESMTPKVEESAYEVKETTWEEKTFVGKKSTLTFNQIAPFFGENWPKIMTDMSKAKIEPTMSPTAIYHKWDQEKGETECSAVMCVPNKTTLKGWETYSIPSSKVLLIEYYGAPGNSEKAHYSMDAYIKKNNLTNQDYVIEEYVTDPGVEKDTAKWLTNIYYVFLNK